MNDWLSFDKFMTPSIIQIIYYIGVALAVLSALGTIISGIGGGGFVMIITGLVFLVLGPIMVRVYCELVIVAFKIHGELKTMNGRDSS